MSYRWFGAALVIAGCGGFGFSIASGYKREEGILRQLLRALNYMEWELQYRLTPLPELCRQAGKETRGTLREVFFNLARELEWQTSPDAASCMTAALKPRASQSRAAPADTGNHEAAGAYPWPVRSSGAEAGS